MKYDRLWTPTFVAILAMTIFSFVAAQGLNSGTSVYFSRIGFAATLAGIGVLVFSVFSAVTRLACGALVNRLGRSHLMVAGSVILIAGIIGFSLSGHVALFIFWRCIQGIGFGMSTTAAATAATDVLPQSRLGEGIGYYGLGQALSLAIGPALALFLVATDPPENLYYGLALSALLALILSLMCRYEKKPRSLPPTSEYRMRWEEASSKEKTAAFKEQGSVGADVVSEDQVSSADDAEKAGSTQGRFRRAVDLVFERRALAGAIPILVISFVTGFTITFIGVLGTSIGVANTGLFFTITAVVMVVVRLSSGRFMDKVIAFRIITVAIVSGIVGYVLIFVCVVFDMSSIANAPFYIAGLFYGVCYGLSLPVNQTVSVRNSPPDRWGPANALYLLCIDLGVGFSAMIWGIVNDNFGFPVTLCCVLACLVLSLIVSYLFYPAREKHKNAV